MSDTFRVEGRLHANGERGQGGVSSAAGGAGGSILAHVHNFDGEGSLEVTGGSAGMWSVTDDAELIARHKN